jgi:FkbM family methyltransferase
LLKLADDFSIISAEEIFMPENIPAPLYNLVVGFEDSRLFFWKGEPWCTSTARELNQEGWCEIVLARISGVGTGNCRFTDYRVIRPNFCDRQHEKNWMPMVVGDELYFLYSSDPTQIIDNAGNLISKKPVSLAFDSFRGGGTLIEFNGGWLALIHESHYMFDNRRRYMHRFVWYNTEGRLARYSLPFYINTLGIEFAAGLAVNPFNGSVIASFGVADRESWLVLVSPEDIWNNLIESPDIVERPVSEDVLFETNRPLANMQIVDRYIDISKQNKLPVHFDRPKNWDNFLAIWHAVNTTGIDEPILDAGASKLSVFLPGLKAKGYTNLTGIDIIQTETEYVDGICYTYGDITRTSYNDGHFGFVACLSVIEHGVDDELFIKEMSRILRIDGHLMVSVDYWQDPIDTNGLVAFDVPVQIYSANDIRNLVRIAADNGLELVGDLFTDCDQRVVSWIGLDYTFMNLLFRKTANTVKKTTDNQVTLSAASNVSMQVYPGDYISNHLMTTGYWEPNLTVRINELAKNLGGTLVDVGSNMGYFSLLWANGNTNNNCYSLEPVERNIQILRKNIELNGFEKQISVLPVAAANVRSIASFDLGDSKETGHGGLTNNISSSNCGVVTIKLDDYFDSIDVLKIDTEGADALVLEGAQNLLSQKKIKVVFFEVNIPRCLALGIQPTTAESILTQNGYTLEIMSQTADLIEYMATPN